MSLFRTFPLRTFPVAPTIAAAVAALCLLPALTVPASAAPAVSASRSCSAAGLSFTRTDGSLTYSVTVARLRVRAAPCATARAVARAVARRDLRTGRVPRASGGYPVTAVEACPGCTPNTTVVAGRGATRITFTLLGGR